MIWKEYKQMGNKAIKDYAITILTDAECDEHSYYNVPAETIINDLKEAFPDGMQYPYEHVAAAIADYSEPRITDIVQQGFDFDDLFGAHSWL